MKTASKVMVKSINQFATLLGYTHAFEFLGEMADEEIASLSDSGTIEIDVNRLNNRLKCENSTINVVEYWNGLFTVQKPISTYGELYRSLKGHVKLLYIRAFDEIGRFEVVHLPRPTIDVGCFIHLVSTDATEDAELLIDANEPVFYDNETGRWVWGVCALDETGDEPLMWM